MILVDDVELDMVDNAIVIHFDEQLIELEPFIKESLFNWKECSARKKNEKEVS